MLPSYTSYEYNIIYKINKIGSVHIILTTWRVLVTTGAMEKQHYLLGVLLS